MARHKSVEKRHRQSQQQNERNRSRRSRIRTFIKKVEGAIASGEPALAEQAFRLAQPEIHRGVAKGIFHRNTGARKLSRLSSRIGALRSRTESKPEAV